MRNGKVIVIIQTEKINCNTILNLQDYLEKMKVCIYNMHCVPLNKESNFKVENKFKELI